MAPANDHLRPAFAVALVVHAAALAWVMSRPSPPPPARPRPPVRVRLSTRPPPTPIPVPVPPPELARPAVVSRVPRPPPKRTAERVTPRPEPPPTRPEPPPTPAAPSPAPQVGSQPRRFAVSMDAVVQGGGGLAMPTTPGATAARGDPRLPPSAPAGDDTARATQPAADVTEVERAPELLHQPASNEMRALYPEAARREGLEADVQLEILVGEGGRVDDVRIVRPAGRGFDEAAAELARKHAFRPATRGGRPVAVWIHWTLKFRLDG